MPVVLVAALFAGAAVLNLGAGFLATVVVRSGFEGDFHLPTVGGGAMEIALVEPEAELEPEVEPDDILDGKELVKLDRVEKEEAPEDSKYISEFDSTAARQTRKHKGEDGKPSPPSQTGRPGAESASQGRDEGTGQGKGSQGSEGQSPGAGQTGEGEGPEADLLDPRASSPSQQQPEGKAGAKGGLSLQGSTQLMRETFGMPSTRDGAEDLEEGAENLINTKRHQYASFFNRVRSAISERWSPNDVMRTRDPDGKKFGQSDRTTVLRIRLRRDGGLERVWVLHESGIAALDEEAIRSVRAAAPFTNPPEGLVDAESGFIEFNFGFRLLFNGGTQIFRFQR